MGSKHGETNDARSEVAVMVSALLSRPGVPAECCAAWHQGAGGRRSVKSCRISRTEAHHGMGPVVQNQKKYAEFCRIIRQT